jgi:hypothetical protein
MIAAALLLSTAYASCGQSGAPSISHSEWRISNDGVVLQVVFPKAQEELLRAELTPVSVENLGKYVLDRVSVTLDGELCPALDQGYDIGEVNPLALGPTLDGFEIIFGCPAARRAAADFTLQNRLFFAERSVHTDFAFIVKDNASVFDTFTASRQVVSVPGNGALPRAGRNRFAHLGVSHIWRNADQWLALAGFFLILRGRNWLLAVFACLSGCALATTLVATGMLVPYEDAAGVGLGLVVTGLAAALVSRTANNARILSWALAIAGVASGAVAWLFHRPDAALLLSGLGIAAAAAAGAPANAGLMSALLALLYGVVLGLTLPVDFARLQILERLPAADSLAFATGALLSASLFMTLLASVHWLLRKARVPVRAILQDTAAAAMAGLGVFWTVSRLLS